jgi:hypothetical protein
MEKYNITYEMVIEKNKHIKEASEEIWEFILNNLQGVFFRYRKC